MNDWNPGQYLTFADERTRPARDLLAQVPLSDAGTVYDLGCGPGNSTSLLVQRFPNAEVAGVDSSQAMLAAGRAACPAARFIHGDLSSWQPEIVPNLVFANASLQWVPDHLAVIERLGAGLSDGGVLAVQMPDNLAEPSHAAMRQVAKQGPWTSKLARAAEARHALPDPLIYYTRLKPLFRRLDIWHANYHHPLNGVRGIVEWLKSTGLRPYLDPLGAAERAQFLERYQIKLAEFYPAGPDGTVLLRFPRLFLVGQR